MEMRMILLAATLMSLPLFINDVSAQIMVCTTSTQEANCDLTATEDGRHIIRSTAYARGGFDKPNVWVEIYANDQMCGERKIVYFINGTGAVTKQCGLNLKVGKSYRVKIIASNHHATAAGVTVNVFAIGLDLDLQ